MNTISKRVAGVGAAAAISIAGLGAAETASAKPVTQEGLVNVNLSDVVVSVPIAVAANVCDVNVAVLVGTVVDAPVDCTASADPDSQITLPEGGPVSQNGLVNVNISNLVVDIPIGIAANICDVNVGVLVQTLLDTPADCDATSTPSAITSLLG